MNKITTDLLGLATPLTDLKSLERNPRKGDVELVMKSYDQFGQRKPIVALRDGTVIAGNHQFQAATRLGWDSIAVVRVDDDEAAARAYAVADNKTGLVGEWDRHDGPADRAVHQLAVLVRRNSGLHAELRRRSEDRCRQGEPRGARLQVMDRGNRRDGDLLEGPRCRVRTAAAPGR